MKKLLQTLFILTLSGFFALMNGQVSVQPASDTPDMVKVYVKQDPVTYQKSSAQSAKIDFAVQVSASSKPVNESSAKKEWDGIGNVYVQQENGLYKTRIGPFKTQQEAKEILLQVKAKGRKDAFIVVLQGTANDKPMSQSEMEKKSAKQTKAEMTKATETATMTTTSASVESEYKVRVASYLKPGGFNPNGIDKLGQLESYRKGDWTIMMIGGFKNLNDAQKAKDIVVSKGFSDAAVVVDRNGILEEVKN